MHAFHSMFKDNVFVLFQIRIPCLFVNAMDDPLVPPELLYIPKEFAGKLSTFFQQFAAINEVLYSCQKLELFSWT
jgi:hypothetical protein